MLRLTLLDGLGDNVREDTDPLLEVGVEGGLNGREGVSDLHISLVAVVVRRSDETADLLRTDGTATGLESRVEALRQEMSTITTRKCDSCSLAAFDRRRSQILDPKRAWRR